MNHQTLRDAGAIWRYVWISSQLGLIAMLAWSIVGVIICQTLGDSIDDMLRLNERSTLRSWVMVLTQFPLLMYATVVFGNNSTSLDSGTTSSYDPFLLRLPVSSFILTTIPLMSKWILVVVAVSLALATYASSWSSWYGNLWISLSVSLACIGTVISGLIWRPYRRFWTRAAALLVFVPIAYGLVVLPFGHQELNDWPGLYFGSIPTPTLVLWMGAVGLCFHSIPLARSQVSPSVSIAPIVPQKATTSVQTGRAIPKPSMTMVQALRWWNVRRLPELLWWLKSTIVLMFMLLTISAPLGVGMMIAQLFMLGVVVHVGGGGWGFSLAQSKSGQRRRTPDWLAVSAVSLNRLAGEKVRWSILVSIAIVTFAVSWWTCQIMLPGGQVAWWNWASELSLVDTDDQATGLRVSWSLIVAAMAMTIGRSLAILWLDLLANERVTVVVTLVLTIAWILGVSVFLSWFLRQTDWSEVRQTWDQSLQWVPTVMLTACLLKVVAVTAAIVMALRQPGSGRQWTLRVLSVWLATVVAVSILLIVLMPTNLNLPDSVAAWPWTAMIASSVVVTFPLARVLILPWAIAQDIHR